MAFEQVGGMEYLVRLAQEDPKTFVPLLIGTLPPEPKSQQQNGLNIVIDLTSRGRVSQAPAFRDESSDL